MRAVLAFLVALACVAASAGMAETRFGARARVLPAETTITDTGEGAQIVLGLSQGVPFRLFTLDDPARLVVDFQEVDWTGLSAAGLETQRIPQVETGTYVPGLSRLVAVLGEPMLVETAGLTVDAETGGARLDIALIRTDAESFAAAAGAPADPRWDRPPPASAPVIERQEDTLVVAIDPGHGGIDPGAEHGDLVEKDLMLDFALELRDRLLREGGFRVILTRDADYFVSLERRVALAHQAGADLFLSLHADALAEGRAHGATVYTLSPEASDAATEKLAIRHDRSQILAGLDLSGADDEVTGVLLDLARQETGPRALALAGALVEAMAQTGGPMNRRPHRMGSFSVLKAADIPSVLIEIGFLSSPRDRKNLGDSAWRAQMAAGIVQGVVDWRSSDALRQMLLRQ